VNAVTATRHEPDDDPNAIRVSGIIQPVQLRALMKRHEDQLEEDAADRIFSLMGTLLHDVLEKSAQSFDHCTTEEALSTEILGWKVTGHYDLTEFILDGEWLTDWKLTSVYAMKDKDLKPEWDAQVNIYAHLLRLNGKIVSKAQIVAIGRDWSRSRASRESDYPQRQVIVKPVPLWSSETVNAYLHERVALHQRADREGIWPECTEEERWARPAKWAIMKKGNKKATKLCDSEKDAQGWLEQILGGKNSYSIDYRPGESIRCQSYCPVSHLCEQAKKLHSTLSDTLENSIKVAQTQKETA